MLGEIVPNNQGQPLLNKNLAIDVENSNFSEAEISRNKSSKNDASLTTTVLNMCNNIVGAGILSLPHAFMDASIVGATLLLIMTCFLSSVSMVVLAFCCKVTKTTNFYTLAESLVGTKFSVFLQVCLWIYTYLSCIAFLILIGDFLGGESGLLRSLCSKNCSENYLFVAILNRKVIILLVTLTILLPLCLKKNLHSLRNTSLLSFLSMLYLAGFMIYNYNKSTEQVTDLHYFMLSPKFFRAAPIVNVAYICHYNSPKYYEEFHSNSIKSFSYAVFISFILCSVVYFLVGLYGYLLFGNAVLGDVLINFRGNSLDIILAKLSLTLTVMFTYPLAFNAFRISAFNVMKNFIKDLDTNNIYYIISTLILIVCSLIPGLVLRDIAVVLDYKGSTLGGLIGFGLAGLFLYQINTIHPGAIKYPRQANFVILILFLWSIITSVLGIFVTTKSVLNGDT